MVTAAARRPVAWTLALAALATSSFGWLALWAAASWAVVSAWWVAVGFFASVPMAILGLLIARRQPLLKAPAVVSGLALFLFISVWVAFLAIKMAA